jgi:hypothetical protein
MRSCWVWRGGYISDVVDCIHNARNLLLTHETLDSGVVPAARITLPRVTSCKGTSGPASAVALELRCSARQGRLRRVHDDAFLQETR